MTTIGEANGKSSTFTINSYPDRLCGPPVVVRASRKAGNSVKQIASALRSKACAR